MSNKIKILYVDDEVMNLTLFGYVFSKKYEVLTSISPVKALDILAETDDINVVVSDMRMPEMTGIEFIEKAHEDKVQRAYYILSAFEKSAEIKSAIKNSVIEEYFQKPFKFEEIEEAILTYMSKIAK